MSNLIIFEKESNPLLNKVKNEYSDLIKKILHKNIVIVIPHSQCFTLIKQIDKPLVYSHIFYVNPDNKSQWMSMNGLKGTFGERYDVLNVLTEDVTSDVLDPGKNFGTKTNSILYKIQILRLSDVSLHNKTIPLYLIAEPIRFKGCSWKSFIATENDTKISELIEMQKTSESSPFLEDVKKKKTFSFQDFVEKMKHKSTLGLVKKIKQFVDMIHGQEYKDNTPQVVAKFMREMEDLIVSHSHWKGASDLELENAREGIEKYIMTKLYNKVFSPQVEDLQLDNELSIKLTKFANHVKPDHLDIPNGIESDPKWALAIEELSKMNNYKTPRDKLICISNCCKSIFSLIHKTGSTNKASADEFLPVLVFLVCKSNVPHLHSNMKYIMDFRNPDRLMSEMGYHLTNMQSAIMFWQNVIPKELNMTQEEFDTILEIKSVTNPLIIKPDDSDDTIALDTLPHEFYSYMDLLSIARHDFETRDFEDLTVSNLKQVFADYQELLKMYDHLKEMSKIKKSSE